MKLLFINPSVQNKKNTLIPLGLASVVSNTQKRLKDELIQSDVRIIDMNSSGLHVDEVVSQINSYDPDFIGITSLVNSVNVTEEIIRKLRHTGVQSKIIMGGVYPSLYPEEIMKISGVDFIVRGEGEDIFPKLITQMSQIQCEVELKKKLKESPGLVFRDGSKLIDTGFAPRINLETLVMPAYDLFSQFDYTWEGRKTINIETSRGCQGYCTYCATPRMFRKGISFKSPEVVLKEIDHLHTDLGYTDFYIVDDSFMTDKERVKIIAKGIINRGYDIRLETFCKPEILIRNAETLGLLRKAGMDLVFIGPESGDEQIRKSYRKTTTNEQVSKALDACWKNNISVVAGFMIGALNESEETVLATITYANELKKVAPYVAHVTVTSPIPGTELWDQANSQGFLVDYDMSTVDFHGKPKIRSAFLSPDQIETLYFKFLKGFYTDDYVDVLRKHPMLYKSSVNIRKQIEEL